MESGVKVLLEMISRRQENTELSAESDLIPTAELIEDLVAILKVSLPSRNRASVLRLRRNRAPLHHHPRSR